MSDRIQIEKDFHNDSFANDIRKPVRGFYKVIGRAHNYYETRIKEVAGTGGRVLEYGCGPGSYAFPLAQQGADVVGIDISEVAIEQASAKAEEMGLNIDFQVMNAEDLEFEDNSFDVICGTSIIHHLELDTAYAEINRVLKPGGVCIFLEPMGHNPLINAYRRFTPNLRTPDEHPLLVNDLTLAERTFSEVKTEYFTLFSLAWSPFASKFKSDGVITALDNFDQLVFRTVPYLRRMAWLVVMELTS